MSSSLDEIRLALGLRDDERLVCQHLDGVEWWGLESGHQRSVTAMAALRLDAEVVASLRPVLLRMRDCDSLAAARINNAREYIELDALGNAYDLEVASAPDEVRRVVQP